MRAKLVFENMEFERGRDPKEVMDLGGIELDAVYAEITDRAQQEYEDFIRNTFIGKKVRGTMDSWSRPSGDWKEWTIVPVDIDHRFHGLEFSFIDKDGERYTVLTSEPLRVLGKINEEVNFERSGNPKRGLDIGGFKLSYIRKDILDQAKDDWMQWIYDYIVGHTVSGKFNRIAKVTEDGYEFTGEQWDNYTVKVKDLVSPETIEMDNHALFVVGEDDYQYVIPIDDKKIWIKNES